MAEVLIAVAEGSYVLDAHAVLAVLRERWPQTSWSPTRSEDPDSSLGQFSVESAGNPTAVLLADLLPVGQGMGVEGSFDMLAEFIAQLTRLRDFPRDGTIIVTDWAMDLYPLQPAMDAGEIRSAFVG